MQRTWYAANGTPALSIAGHSGLHGLFGRAQLTVGCIESMRRAGSVMSDVSKALLLTSWGAAGIVAIILLMLLMLPVVFFMLIILLAVAWVWLRNVNRDLRQLQQDSLAGWGGSLSDPSLYAAYRNQYDELSGAICTYEQASQRIGTFGGRSSLRMLAPHFREMEKMSAALKSIAAQMRAQLDQLDRHAPSNDLMMPATEAQLWDSRNPAYRYLV